MQKRDLLYRLLLVLVVALTAVSAWSMVAAQEATPEATPDTTEAAPDTQGRPDRPFLGVSLEDGDGGAVIREVVAGSSAEEAGLQVGDVITQVNDTAVANARETVEAVRALNVGDSLTLEITRGDETQTLTVTLANLPDDLNGPQLPGRDRDRHFGLSYNAQNQTWTINELNEDSPLYEAGLRQGDVIQQFDGQAYDPRGLIEHLASLNPDDTVTLTILRDGSTQDIDVVVSALFEMGSMGFGQPGQGFPFPMPFGMGGVINGYLGVQFVTLDEQTASENDVTQTEGALVKEVVAGSPAAEAGLQVNDIITAVNGEAVDEEHTLRDRLIAYEPADVVTLDVTRGQETLQIEVTLDEAPMGQMMQMMPFFGGGRGQFVPGGDQWSAPTEPQQPQLEQNSSL